ncbi:MAG: hypothetical protein IJM59_03240 [Proteobacteria bacterium]|nr:hypothetical protein [Pseudomonadota bacterium]
MNRIILVLLTVGTFVCISGCQNEREQLEQISRDLTKVSEMTDDCPAMAEALAPLTKKYNGIIDSIGKQVPEESERALYIDAVSQCQRVYLEISTGTCGSDDAVRAALPFDVKPAS